MLLSYTARDAKGQITKGEAEAENENDLAEKLSNRGLFLTEVKTNNNVTDTNRARWSLSLFNRVKMVDKIFFTQNLQVMIKAGLTVTVALNTLAEQTTNKNFKKILFEAKNEVEKGQTLSDALAKYPKIFPELFVNMIRAGEKSGKLEEVLLQLTNQMRKSHALISKVKSAMTYPVVILCAMVLIGIVMIIFVVPQITIIFRDFDAELPLPTKILLFVSDFVSTKGHYVALAAIVLIGLFIYLINTPTGKKNWHKFLLRLPIFNKIFKQINLAKFSRTFSSLLKTDIPVVQAFQITATTVSNVCYKEALLTAAEEIKTGKSVSQSIASDNKLFPPLVIQMSAVGEETGTLDSVLTEMADFYEEEVDRIMSNLSTIIEPILMLILGVAVGFFAISIIMPMYSLTQQI